jgi:hypothetical protein
MTIENIKYLNDTTTMLIMTLLKTEHCSSFLSSYSTCKFFFTVISSLLEVKSVISEVRYN